MAYSSIKGSCSFPQIAGSTGLQGRQGDLGTLVDEIYVFNFASLTVASGASFVYDKILVSASPVLGMSFTAPSAVILTEVGIYSVEYYALPQTANTTLALFLGNTEIPGSRFTAPSGSESITGRALFALTMGQIPVPLTSRNVDTKHTAKLQSGYLSGTVNASIFVQAMVV